MTNREFQIAFEVIALKYVNIEEKPYSKEIEFWLNMGLEKFVKTRYSGVNAKRKGFEQDQKRIEDLGSLISSYKRNSTEQTIQVDENFRNGQVVYIDRACMFIVGERACVLPRLANKAITECWEKDDNGKMVPHCGDVTESTIESIDKQINNSLSNHLLHRQSASPLRLQTEENDRIRISLISDGKYYVSEYVATCIRRPRKIDIHTPNTLTSAYSDLPIHTHSEIVLLAVEMYLENKQSPRYQTFLNEVATME